MFILEQSSSYMVGLTMFSDMTETEFRAYLGFSKDAWRSGTKDKERVPELNERAVPDSFDWRDEGMVSPVKNQGGCGYSECLIFHELF